MDARLTGLRGKSYRASGEGYRAPGEAIPGSGGNFTGLRGKFGLLFTCKNDSFSKTASRLDCALLVLLLLLCSC